MFKKIFNFGKKKKEEDIIQEQKEINEIEEVENEEQEVSEKTENIQEQEIKSSKMEENEIEDKEISEIKDDEEVNQETEDVQEQEMKEEVQEQEKEEKKVGFFAKLKKGLEKTRNGIVQKVDNVLKNYRKIDEELFEDLEEILITADIGVTTTLKIIDDLKDKVRERKIEEPSEIKNLLKEEIIELLNANEEHKIDISPSPAIMIVVGVNGVGKTTTIGKLSHRFKKDGKKVLVAAGDTFRAAAIEQLAEWCNRSNVDIIANSEGTDSASIIFDAIQAAKARKTDVLICDTAGRLHNKKNLMNELSKIFKIVDREYPNAKREVLLVVDATTGQNAVLQAKAFNEVCDITGIALTKLDGTAKGGVVLAVQSEVNVPVKLVGVGEGIDDLQDFDPKNFAEALFSE